jgi:hypothetical protein
VSLLIPTANLASGAGNSSKIYLAKLCVENLVPPFAPGLFLRSSIINFDSILMPALFKNSKCCKLRVIFAGSTSATGAQ